MERFFNDVPTWLQLFPIFVAIVLGYRRLVSTAARDRRRRLREEFMLAQRLLTGDWEGRHPYVLSKWFSAVSGGKRLPASKIRCALKCDAADTALDLFYLAGDYVAVERDDSGLLVPRAAHSENSLRNLSGVLAGSYFIFSLMGFIPLALLDFQASKSAGHFFGYFLVVSVPCGFIAIGSAMENRKISAARKLVAKFGDLRGVDPGHQAHADDEPKVSVSARAPRRSQKPKSPEGPTS